MLPLRQNSSAESIIPGTVTYTTSKSLYVLFERMPMVTEGDSILVGDSPQILTKAQVKAVSNQKLVFEKNSSLAPLAEGNTVYAQLPLSNGRKTFPRRKLDNREQKSASSPHHPVSLSGRASLQYYLYKGDGGVRDYDQPSLFLDTHVTNFSSIPLTVNFRLRTRLYRELSAPEGKEKRSNQLDRLYDLSLEYGAPQSSYHVNIGRMRNIKAGGMGGIDGVVVERTLPSGIRGGLYGGVVPILNNLAIDKRAMKRGCYFLWETGSNSRFAMDASVAYSAENREDISTEHLVYVGHSLYYRGTVSIFQEAVFNVRPVGQGLQSKPIQNIRSYITYTPFQFLRLSANYRGYYIQEYRDFTLVTDPLDNLRDIYNHTFLPSVEFILPNRISVTGDMLLGKEQAGSTKVLSYALRSRASNLFNSGFSGSIAQIETTQYGIDGHYTSLSLSRTVFSKMSITLSGSYSNNVPLNSRPFHYNNFRMGIFQSVGKLYYYSLNFGRSWGDTAKSFQMFAEWGIRLAPR